MTHSKRHVVVLLGMHRSGTSLAMSVIHSLGVACGNDLIPAGRGNPAGFWEHSEIVAVHEQLLVSLGRVWHGPTGTYPLPAGWLETGDAQAARTTLVELIRKELDATENGVWGFKDPRTLQLLPLWQRVFDEAGATPIFILVVRHPTEVCASLLKQNGVDPVRGQLVWMQYNMNAVLHAGDALRLVMDYDNLVNDPDQEVNRLTSALGGVVAITETDKSRARERVSQKLRSHDKTESVIANGLVREAYERLSCAARDQDRLANLLSLATKYREAEELFEPWRRDRRSLLADWLIRALLRRKYP